VEVDRNIHSAAEIQRFFEVDPAFQGRLSRTMTAESQKSYPAFKKSVAGEPLGVQRNSVSEYRGEHACVQSDDIKIIGIV